MKAVIHIECTPAEARAFLGLPDVEPIQAAVLERLQERMVSEIDRFSPEALINQWLSVFPENVERMQDLFGQMFLGGTQRTGPDARHRPLSIGLRSSRDLILPAILECEPSGATPQVGASSAALRMALPGTAERPLA